MMRGPTHIKLVLFREITAVYFENHQYTCKSCLAKCGNLLFNVTADGMYVTIFL